VREVIIIGGGIAGLAVAYELRRQGLSFVLLEGSARAGGVVLSEEIDGFTIDAGPDSLLVQKPAALELCEDIGLGSRLVPTSPPRLAYIQRGGRLHALPASSVLGIPTRVGPFLRTGLFSPAGKLRMGAELFVPRRRDDGGESDESIGAFMTRRFGPEACEYLAEPLLAGIHAGDVDRLSMPALFPRLVDAEQQHGSVLRAFRAERSARSTETQGAFRSLPGGLSEMIRALVATLPAEAVRLGSPVTAVRRLPGGSYLVDAAGGTLEARSVVAATPAYVTARLLRALDPGLAGLCGGIRYVSTATIVLAYARGAVAHPLHGTGFVVPRREAGGILAGSWLSSKWPHRAPAGRVLLRAFVGGARDPHALDRPDDELVSVAITALARLLGISGAPLLTRVYRWERGSAQHDVGHLARVAAIERALAAHPGLYVTGSGFRGTGIPDCVADGRATARSIADTLRM
jgi:oxygen-dependent protoporphyrinogen oxidase